MKITSVNNELIKETAKLLQKKYRDESGLFILEGEKCVHEAMLSGLEIVHIFEMEGTHVFKSTEVTQAVMSKISSTKTPPKVLAVAKKLDRKWKNNYKKVILLEGIKDAGNLGTILRSAAAFEADAVILYGDTIDLYNPKCVRSSTGNFWKAPVFEINEFNFLAEHFDKFERIATLPKSENSVWLNDYTPAEKVLLMFGSEADGLSKELKDFATINVTIEMSKSVESLNLGISAGIFLYKIFSCRTICK